MTVPPPEAGAAGDTYDRSCAHWSEDRRAGMEQFYQLAAEDYRQLAIASDWAGWLRRHCQGSAGEAVQLLDVACGSGKFPRALRAWGGIDDKALPPIAYDLLDPSAFSLAEARAALSPPFTPRTDYQCRLQDLPVAACNYDVVWATHALYAVPRGELRDALARFVAALAPGGSGFIAHACADAHYHRFYRFYLDAFRPDGGTPYTTAEEIVEVFEELGVHVESSDIVYEARAGRAEADAVEGYLQRCLFDDTLTLEAMLAAAGMGEYLSGCRDQGDWRFRQRVKLLYVTGHGDS
ncbi:MAG: class I SAM-dependent methyltransferase [Gammaproteobacteria bacterium]|nr:class I SAM-dependent methyltransferase [Gammaproteobacteria bacterium]